MGPSLSRCIFGVSALAVLTASSALAQSAPRAFGPGGQAMARSGTIRHVTGAAFGNGLFVAVGFHRTILTSSGGTNWVEQTEPPDLSAVGINYTTEVYSAGGQSLTFVSPQDNSAPIPRPSPFQFRAVAFGGSKFVIVGETGEIHVSSDGEKWHLVRSPTQASLSAIGWGGGEFVAVGYQGTILSSADALTWTPRDSGTSLGLAGVAYGNNTFVVVGGDMDNSVILTSPDGLQWTSSEVNRRCPIGTIAFGGGRFMASAGGGYQLTMTSADGKEWRQVAHPCPAVLALSYGNGRFVAVDAGEQPVSSADGSAWQPVFAQRRFGFHFKAATFGSGKYVAVGSGDLAVSDDAINWEQVELPRSKLLWGRIIGRLFSPHQFGHPPDRFSVPLLPSGRPDLQQWRTGGGPIAGNVADGELRIRRPNDNYLEEAVLYSEDGITWTRLQPLVPSAPQAPAIAGAASTAQTASVGIEFKLDGRPYRLSLAAGLGKVYELQASTDLEYWQVLTVLTNNGTGFNYVDQDASKYPHRFYRLGSGPNAP